MPDLEEAGRDAARGPRREWILGMVLIVAVLGIGAANWARGESGSAAYRRGAGAAATAHWAQAAAAFREAGDWRDAPARAAAAATQLQQFAAFAAQGQAAAARHSWPAAVAAYAAAAAITPDDPAVAQALAGARQALQATGLAGTVALVVAGPQPGLYLRPGPVYLPGSDAGSRVRAIAPDGRRFLYDRSTGAGRPAPVPLPRSDFWIPSHAAAEIRQVVLVQLDPSGTPVYTVLPATLDGHGMGLFLGDTLWWYASSQDLGYYSYAVTYYDLRDGSAGTVAGPSGRLQPIAWRPDGSLVAIAAYGSVPAGAEPQATIYLANARGTRLRDVWRVDGTVGASGFSPDGLYLFFQVTGQASVTQRIYMAGTALTGPEGRQGAEMVEGLSVPATTRGGLTATWIGPGAGLLINTWGAGGEQLARYQPGRGGLADAWSSLWEGPPRPDVTDLAAIAPGGAPLAWRLRTRGGQDQIALLPAQGAPRVVPIAIAGGDSLEMTFAPRGNYLVYGGYNLQSPARSRRAPIYSLPVTGTGAPVRLGERIWDPELPSLTLPAAGILIAYINPQQELHAATYDGSTDLVVAPNVAAIWSLQAPGAGWVH